MPLKSALRWSLYDRTLAVLPFLLGLAITAGGVWVGAGAFLNEIAFGDPSDAGSPASIPIVIGGLVAGLLVWQIGRSAVRHHTTRRAMANQVDELVDDERIASNAASKVDDRIADVENDVEQLSRKVTRIEQQVRGDELGSDELAGAGSSTGAIGSSAAATTTDATESSEGEDESTTGSADDGETDASTASGAADESDASGGATAAEASPSGDAGSTASDTAAETAEGAAAEETAEENAAQTDADEPEPADATDADDSDDPETAAGDDGADDADDSGTDDGGFEWEDDDDDEEYYRDS